MSNPSNTPPQFSLLLRLLGGGYLVYLAWDIRTAYADGLIFIAAGAVFALTGAALLAHSLWSLVRHEYFQKNSESTEDGAEESRN